jgi:F0F1-type ATP synthase beta subunit
MNKGTIIQIFGAVVDVKFDMQIPNILNALKYQEGDREIIF